MYGQLDSLRWAGGSGLGGKRGFLVGEAGGKGGLGRFVCFFLTGKTL